MTVRASRHRFGEKRLGKVRSAAGKVELSVDHWTCFVIPRVDATTYNPDAAFNLSFTSNCRTSRFMRLRTHKSPRSIFSRVMTDNTVGSVLIPQPLLQI